MTDTRDLLILDLASLLATRLTKAGHLAQLIDHEHRGNCLPPSRGCTPACIEARAALTQAAEHLERVVGERPRQLAFAEVG